MKKLITIIAITATLCAGETLQSVSVSAGNTSSSWTNTAATTYLSKIIYTMSEATTTNETLTFTVTYATTGSLASNESAVVVSLPKQVMIASNTVVTVGRTAATTNTVGNAVLVLD